MNIGVFEDPSVDQLLPLVWLRAAFELRCGPSRLIDKIQKHCGLVSRIWVRDLVRESVEARFELAQVEPRDDWLLINAATLVTSELPPLEAGTAWKHNGRLVAVRLSATQFAEMPDDPFEQAGALDEWAAEFRAFPAPDTIRLIEYPWDLITHTTAELLRECRAGGSHLGLVHAGAHLVEPQHIHIGHKAQVKPGAVLDASDGPIHVEAGVHIQPGAVLIGPCYIGAKSIIRPGASIREGSAIGPHCRVGGEVEASVIHSYSNKQHDGFLGHSYVGSWVNLGAGTITSDLKNTYGAIRASVNGAGVETGLRFLGSIIGDHAKTGIGAILATGCIIGVAANVFTQAAAPRFVPSFAWLTGTELAHYRVEKAIDIARFVMSRRQTELSMIDESMLRRCAQVAAQVEAAGWK